jgi:hypothetical protein
MNLNSSGISMLLRAMGFDPELLAQKAVELEQFGKQAIVQIQAGVESIDTRLAAIEGSLIALHNKLDAQMSGTAYAGESTVHLLIEAPAPAPEAIAEHESKESKHGRRISATDRTHRSNRKAS